MNSMMIDSTTNFNGRIATSLCKKLGVSAETKIPGADDLILTGIQNTFSYNRYKNGINYKSKSFHDYMESSSMAVFYNKNTPEITTEVKINNCDIDLNPKILDYITPEVAEKAETKLDAQHKLNTLF